MDDLFEQLQEDARSLWCPSTVKRLDGMPSPDLFYKEYVATSTPVIISGGAETLRIAGSWDDLSSLAEPDLEVTVDFTPDGRGDCVVNLGSSKSREDENGEICDVEVVDAPADVNTSVVFVKPEERRIKFSNFVDLMLSRDDRSIASSGSSSNGSKGGEVPYLSHQSLRSPEVWTLSRRYRSPSRPLDYTSQQPQHGGGKNDSLRREFPGLMGKVEPFLKLAREAFGNEPDAVNLWIGDERSLSAVHKDHYENMYCVVRGQKHFTLLPPSDVLFLYEREYPQGRYRRKADGTGFGVEMEEGSVPWIPVDPACPDLENYPMFRHASPVSCSVGPGDILYLPALWYHRVAQKGLTVAVNYWHDMQFDFKYVYYSFLQRLAQKNVDNPKVLLREGAREEVEPAEVVPAHEHEERS